MDLWDIIYLIGGNLYFIVFIALMIISFIIQVRLNSTYKKYSKIANGRGLTGAQAAEKILSENGITDVEVQMVSGHLTDNYNPRTKVLSLSPEVYSGFTVAAVGIAVHIFHAYRAHAQLADSFTIGAVEWFKGIAIDPGKDTDIRRQHLLEGDTHIAYGRCCGRGSYVDGVAAAGHINRMPAGIIACAACT